MVARFSISVQTGPGAHTASHTMGTGAFPGVKQPGHGINHPPHHLALRLKKEYSYTSTPTLNLHGLFYIEPSYFMHVFVRFHFMNCNCISFHVF
jgi:hypothetical protein